MLAGFIGTFFVSYLRQTTRIKEDTALGLTLASFFAIGVCLLTMIQRLPTGNKSGIDKFMFGQAAAIGEDDIRLMAGVTILIISAVYLFYKELLVTSFDAGFARAIALPSQWIHHLLMLLVAFAVVIALQAVGVVLVSAMLITPAAAAYLLTDRMHRMLFYAVGFGVASGVLGAFVSFTPQHPDRPVHGARRQRGVRRRVFRRAKARRADALAAASLALKNGCSAKTRSRPCIRFWKIGPPSRRKASLSRNWRSDGARPSTRSRCRPVPSSKTGWPRCTRKATKSCSRQAVGNWPARLFAITGSGSFT